MGLFKILKRLSCNCASDCHLDKEIKELQDFVRSLAEDDLREIKDYFLEREEILNKKREEIRHNMRQTLKEKRSMTTTSL